MKKSIEKDARISIKLEGVEVVENIRNLISIVIPVYNVQENLKKCIDSIQKQTYQKIEIIIIDDGSTDGSPSLCDQMQQQDSRISVFHKENRGVVSARKMGLEKAQGEYSLLIDSDDWIEPNMVAELYQAALEYEADIVTSGYYREYAGTYAKVTDGIEEGVYGSLESKRYLCQNLIYCGNTDRKGILGSLCCKLIRTSLLRKVHLELCESISRGEDSAVVYAACIQAKTVVITHNIYYHYAIRAGSAVYSSDKYFFKNINEVYIFLKDIFKKSNYKEILLVQLDRFMLQLIFLGINYWFDFNKKIAIPYYDFDRRAIKENKKVVIYGAGQVGQAFYKQICADGCYKLTGWVDQNYIHYRQQGLNVSEVSLLVHWDYDYIILALKRKDMADMVKQNLMEQYGLDANKLLWLEPVSIIEKYN